MEKLERLTISAQTAQEAVHHVTNIPTKICQPCLCCKNTRELPEGFYSAPPWVCDECKEAIAFVKELRASIKAAPAEGHAGEIKAETVLL
jgi:hypothetical protein